MVIESPAKKYRIISPVFHGAVNDSYICTLGEESGNRYVLNVIFDRKQAKQLAGLFGARARCDGCFDCFTWQDGLCLVFPWHESRSLRKFLLTENIDREALKQLAVNLVMECMTFQVPYPVLGLIIRQKKFNLFSDYKVNFDCCLDFKNLDIHGTQEDCAADMAEFLLNLFAWCGMTDSAAYTLIGKKKRRNGYRSFVELYGDLKNAELSLKKSGFFVRVRGFFRKRGDVFFHIFKYLLIVLTVIAVITLICQFTIGDIPFLRIFTNTFKAIGKRKLGS